MMRGASRAKFELRDGGRIPLDRTRAVACAASYNIDRTAFEALPDAAQYAWGWVAFNEAAERAVSGLANVQTIRYEDLCENPEHIARTVLSFAGLDWHPQTADFVRHSANYKGKSGYYSVFQHAALVSERWRTEMSEKDQWAVGEVARLSPLARHWLPELAPP
jgi:hypothetical protein